MHNTFRIRLGLSCSNNRKSEIGNLNWARLFAMVVAVMVSGTVVQAQQPKRIFRIEYLSSVDPASDSARAVAIRQALRELGYIEGQNIAIEYRYTEGNRDRFNEIAAELVRIKVDIIVVAGGFGAIMAARNATKTIP